nr:FkbM family methyltransferase [Nitrosomonas nitrosa]
MDLRHRLITNARLIIPNPVSRLIRRLAALIDPYATKSYAQEGEDLILLRLLNRQPQGFYVDVGAHHPRRFSNTYLFFQLGWHGINIDPNPEAIALFNKDRPGDCNLLVGVSDRSAELAYYRFNETALNTFDQQLADERKKIADYRLVDTVRVKVERLDVLFERHLPQGQPVDFLSVDAEGLDLSILQSNDWKRFRPRFVLAECLKTSLSDVATHPVYQFMSDVSYELIAKTLNTVFFQDKNTST